MDYNYYIYEFHCEEAKKIAISETDNRYSEFARAKEPVKGKKAYSGLTLAGPAALFLAAFFTISSAVPAEDSSPPPGSEIIASSPLPAEEAAPPEPSSAPQKSSCTVYFDYNLGDFIILKKRPSEDSSSDSAGLSLTVDSGTELSGDFSLEAENCLISASDSSGDVTIPVIFKGWRRSDGRSFDFSESIEEDTLLYACWSLDTYNCCSDNLPLGGELDSNGNAYVSLKTTVDSTPFGKSFSIDRLLRDDEEYIGDISECICRMSFVFSYLDSSGELVVHKLGDNERLSLDEVSLSGGNAELSWSAVLGTELLEASEAGSDHKLYAYGSIECDGVEYSFSETDAARYPIEFFDPEGSERIEQNGIYILHMDGKVLLINMKACPDAGMLILEKDNSRFTGKIRASVFYPSDVDFDDASDIYILKEGAPAPGFFDVLEDNPDVIAHFQIPK